MPAKLSASLPLQDHPRSSEKFLIPSLDRAEVNEEHKNVIVLKDGTQLYLYEGHIDPVIEQDAPKPRTRPQWNIDPVEGPDKKEPLPQSVVTSTRSRSIFDQH